MSEAGIFVVTVVHSVPEIAVVLEDEFAMGEGVGVTGVGVVVGAVSVVEGVSVVQLVPAMPVVEFEAAGVGVASEDELEIVSVSSEAGPCPGVPTRPISPPFARAQTSGPGAL